MATSKKRLTVEQRSQGQQRVDRNQWLLADRHSATRIFIEHPVRKDHLITIRQLELNDVRPEAGAGSNYAYKITEVWKVGIVNARRARNMGSV